MLNLLKAAARRLRTRIVISLSRSVRRHGAGLHVGANARLWAPDGITLGENVYIGKDVHIECNAAIGDFVLIANRVAFVGRHDHDMRSIGVPVRFGTWIGDRTPDSRERRALVTVEQDVWIGFGAVILSGVTLGRGCVIAAGAVVSADVPPYAIVAGNPAQILKQRFTDNEAARHEAAIRNGRYVFSERGMAHCVIAPGAER